jgi:hypothetical protein
VLIVKLDLVMHNGGHPVGQPAACAILCCACCAAALAMVFWGWCGVHHGGEFKKQGMLRTLCCSGFIEASCDALASRVCCGLGWTSGHAG